MSSRITYHQWSYLVKGRSYLVKGHSYLVKGHSYLVKGHSYLVKGRTYHNPFVSGCGQMVIN